MTIILPLPSSPGAGPSRPTRSFGEPEEPYHVHASLVEIVQAIRGAKRIVVISGAGVSTAARIPDFRSAQGLFSAGKTAGRRLRSQKVVPVVLPLVGKKARTVRDLFHVKSLSDEEMLPAHHGLLNSLYELAEDALPTPFHSYLSKLDRSGQLLRCYTQNIDGLEEKAGLEVGLPQPRERISAKRRRIRPSTPDSRSSSTAADLPCTPPRPYQLATPNSSLPATPQPLSSSSTPTPTNPFPRVIPLHGLLSTVKCTFCPHSVPFSAVHPLPAHHLPCPACSHHSSQRTALAKRKRSEGLLRPSVVLYGEEHPQGHLIGKVVERDLKGLGGKGEKEGKVDFLIVAGTSLSIPGVKRMVKEMAKSLEGRGGIRRIYINDDAPAHPKEMEGVFNAWVKGDVQRFITDYLNNPNFGALPPTPPKTPRTSQSSTPFLSNPASASTKKRKKTQPEPVSPSHAPVLRLQPSSPHPPVIPAFAGKHWKSAPVLPGSPSLTPRSEPGGGDGDHGTTQVAIPARR